MWNRWGLGLWAGLYALALVAMGGCSEEDGGTRIVVTVDSDIAADADPSLTLVEISISGGTSTQTAEADVAGGQTLPRQLILRHEGGGLGPFVVTVTGTLSDGSTVTQTVRDVYFEEGGEIELSLSLDAACVDKCPGESCQAGQCVDVVAPDAGPRDAGPGDTGVDADAGEGGTTPDDSGADADTGTPDAEAGTTCSSHDECSDLTVDCLVGVCGIDGLCTTETLVDGTSCGDASFCLAGTCKAARDCTGGSCTYRCNGNATCAYDCTGASSCNIDCQGGPCVVDCSAALTTCDSVDCSKGGCLLLCAEASSCAFATCFGEQIPCGDGSSVMCGRAQDTCPE